MLFPSAATTAEAHVLDVRRIGDRWAVITDVTPFHPLDHTWPDQPADTGTLAGAAVLDCVTGAVSPDGELLLGSAIPVGRGDPEWTWVVVHLTDAQCTPGQRVSLAVDEPYRASLSAAHTACHLAALALNEVTAGLWRKDPPRLDSLGNPDLDGLAVVRSSIEPWHAIDSYRLGKSIRKKGLDTEALLGGLTEFADQVRRRVVGWIATGAAVSIDTAGDSGIAARRTWRCTLPQGEGRYPCGGTHVASLADLPASTRISYRATDDGFVADTLVR